MNNQRQQLDRHLIIYFSINNKFQKLNPAMKEDQKRNLKNFDEQHSLIQPEQKFSRFRE